jgi:hypothetical protein
MSNNESNDAAFGPVLSNPHTPLSNGGDVPVPLDTGGAVQEQILDKPNKYGADYWRERKQIQRARHKEESTLQDQIAKLKEAEEFQRTQMRTQVEEQVRQTREAEVNAPKTVGEAIEQMQLPDMCKAWLRTHPDYLTDPRQVHALAHANHEVRNFRGYTPEENAQQYLEGVEDVLRRLGSLPSIHTEEEPPPQQAPIHPAPPPPQQHRAAERHREERPMPRDYDDDDDYAPLRSGPAIADRATNYMSAPVSREVAGANGVRQSQSEITLTREEREMARLSGVSEVEYARGKQFLPTYKRMRGDEGNR